jgi:[ribosomal protein S5]-alanine N-acetyltransferase
MSLLGGHLPTLRAARVQLRWLEPRDVDDLFTIFGDPEVMRYWSTPAYTEREQAAQLLAGIERHFVARDLLEWGIADADDRIIGTFTLSSLSLAHRRAEIGYTLARAAWGRGLAGEAVGRGLAYAFDELALHRVEADVDPRNLRSLALLERLGFRREGLLRERWHVAGEICDSLMLGLLAHERPTTRAPTSASTSEPITDRT